MHYKRFIVKRWHILGNDYLEGQSWILCYTKVGLKVYRLKNSYDDISAVDDFLTKGIQALQRQ